MPAPVDAMPRTALRRRPQVRTIAVALSLLALVAAAACLLIELRRRDQLYWYDVRADYGYGFAGVHTVRVPVKLSPEGFVFPPIDFTWDTGVLRMHMNSARSARWFEPSVTVETDGQAVRQFLERGAQGTRYVLLPRSAAPGQEVRLRGDRLHWPAQTAELLLFRTPVPPDPTVLVLAPHPDDAEIAAFGLYAAHRSFVATITAGNYVHHSYSHLAADDAAQEVLRARLRTWDSLAVPSWGGVLPERVVSLGYQGLSLERLRAERDGTRPAGASDWAIERYRQGAVSTLLGGRRAAPTWESLVTDLVTLMEAVRPDIVVAPHPVLDVSADHQFTTLALLEALSRQPANGLVLFLYTNHHILAEYYPFGPSDSHVPPPPWFDEGLPFGSLYSFELDGERQIDKLLALESHHDLREPPHRLLGGPWDRFLFRFGRMAANLARDPVSDYSYYRRAVRPNELFFVYAPPQRQALSAVVAGSGRTKRVAGLR